MAVTYFGLNADGGGVYQPGLYANWNDNNNIVYTCPGSGTQDIKELGARVYTNSVGNMRLAIYTTAGAFLTQGSAEINTEPPTGYEWLSHTSFVDQTGSPHSPQLTGGTAYLLAITGDDQNNVYICGDIVTSGYMLYGGNDYTGGFPANLPSSGSADKQYCVRCGVEASGLSWTARQDMLVGF